MIILSPPLNRVDIARIGLGAAGLALIGVGGIAVLAGIPLEDYPGIVLWLLAAILLHDGVLAPLVVAFGMLGGPLAARLPSGAVAVARGALVAVAIASLASIPPIVAQALGARNPTIHSADYGAALLGLWVAAVLISAVAVATGAIARGRVARTK